MGVFGALVTYIIVKIICFYSGCTFKYEVELLSIISVEISCGFLILMVKNKRIRERLLGDKKGIKIIACSMIFITMFLLFYMLNKIEIGYIFIILYWVNELIGLLYFQGRYIKYDFSFMRIYLKNGGENYMRTD